MKHNIIVFNINYVFICSSIAPGKGMGHKTNAGGGFLKANSLNRAFGGTSALGNRSNSSRKEGGIKVK